MKDAASSVPFTNAGAMQFVRSRMKGGFLLYLSSILVAAIRQHVAHLEIDHDVFLLKSVQSIVR
jgi:hypothetical protein